MHYSYYNTLCDLIDISKKAQSKYLELIKDKFGISALYFAKEFQTIKLCGPRGSGHTYAIAELMGKKFNSSIAITPLQRQSKIIEEIFNQNKYTTNTYYASINNTYSLMGLNNIEAILVDCSSLMSNKKINDIYNIGISLSVYRIPFYYIFLE